MYRRVSVEIGPGETVDCCSPAALAIHAGERCIIQIDRVLESGVIRTVEELDGDMPSDCRSAVQRCMTLQDQARLRENQVRDKMAMESCRREIEARRLPVRLVRVRYSFDRARLAVQFSTDERIDIRDLSQALSTELQTQVELHQIGVRDEAGLIGGVGPCGRGLCCCTWLQRFESVNVKMAKNQQLSLNPTTISGMCGRLKCCLRYENETYVACSRGLPRHGARVETVDGEGTVVDVNIPVRKIKVRLEGMRLAEYAVEDIRVLDSGRSRRRRPPRADAAEEAS